MSSWNQTSWERAPKSASASNAAAQTAASGIRSPAGVAARRVRMRAGSRCHSALEKRRARVTVRIAARKRQRVGPCHCLPMYRPSSGHAPSRELASPSSPRSSRRNTSTSGDFRYANGTACRFPSDSSASAASSISSVGSGRRAVRLLRTAPRPLARPWSGRRVDVIHVATCTRPRRRPPCSDDSTTLDEFSYVYSQSLTEGLIL